MHAATDVTGFGLLGHLREMVAASGVGAIVDPNAMPVIDGVRALIGAGMVAGGTQRNHAFVSDVVEWNDLALEEQLLLADAQTSGGLLLAVAPDRADALIDALRARDTPAAAIVGYATAEHPGRISIGH